MDQVTVISNACGFYIPRKHPVKRSKKSTKSLPEHDTSASELFTRINTENGFEKYQDLHLIMDSAIIPLLEDGLDRNMHQLCDLVVVELTNFISGVKKPAETSIGGIPHFGCATARTPVFMVNMEIGMDAADGEAELFLQYLSDSVNDNQMDTTLVAVDGSQLECLGDLCDSIVRDDLELGNFSESRYGLINPMPNFSSKATEIKLQHQNKNPVELLNLLLGLVYCKNVFKRSGKIVAPFTEKDAERASSTITFVLFDADLISTEITTNLIRILYESGAPVAVVSCYKYLSAAPIFGGFDVSYMVSPGKNITTSDLCNQSERNVLMFTKHSAVQRLLLGPSVIGILLNELAPLHGSAEQINLALKICCVEFYIKYYVPAESISEVDVTTQGLFRRLRDSESFRRFVTTEEPTIRIRLLLDDSYFLTFVQSQMDQLKKYRHAFMALLTLTTELVSSVTNLSWWDVYISIMTKKDWRDCIQLQTISGDLSDAVLQSVGKCRKNLPKFLDLEKDLSTKWTTDLESYEKKNHASNKQGDDLRRWRQKAREGSPLIALLSSLSSHLPSYKSLLFHETLVFDDTSLIRERLCCHLRDDTEALLQDPSSLFKSYSWDSGEVPESLTLPDISFVRSSLLGERRVLNIRKSVKEFQKRLLAVENSKSAQSRDSPTFSTASRARFLSCLPALEALGILSLTQKGQRSSYMIV